MLMPTKAKSRRPRSPMPLLPAGSRYPDGLLKVGWLRDRFAQTSGERVPRLLDETGLSIVTLGASMQWKRHPGRCVFDRDPSRRRMGLRQLIEVAENGFGHGINGIGA